MLDHALPNLARAALLAASVLSPLGAGTSCVVAEAPTAASPNAGLPPAVRKGEAAEAVFSRRRRVDPAVAAESGERLQPAGPTAKLQHPRPSPDRPVSEPFCFDRWPWSLDDQEGRWPRLIEFSDTEWM